MFDVQNTQTGPDGTNAPILFRLETPNPKGKSANNCPNVHTHNLNERLPKEKYYFLAMVSAKSVQYKLYNSFFSSQHQQNALVETCGTRTFVRGVNNGN